MSLDLLGATGKLFGDCLQEVGGEIKRVVNGVEQGLTSAELLQVTNKAQEVQDIYDAKAYARARTYPSIGDQLDMIFHAGLGGDDFQAAIQAVKDANPKT